MHLLHHSKWKTACSGFSIGIPRIKPYARSAIIWVGAFKLPLTTLGITEASYNNLNPVSVASIGIDGV